MESAEDEDGNYLTIHGARGIHWLMAAHVEPHVHAKYGPTKPFKGNLGSPSMHDFDCSPW